MFSNSSSSNDGTEENAEPDAVKRVGKAKGKEKGKEKAGEKEKGKEEEKEKENVAPKPTAPEQGAEEQELPKKARVDYRPRETRALRLFSNSSVQCRG
jgi:hypothetical protein